MKKTKSLWYLIPISIITTMMVIHLTSIQIFNSQPFIPKSEIFPIVIPTYQEHFHLNIQFLESFVKNVDDFSNILILFIVSNRNEVKSLLKLIYTNPVLIEAFQIHEGGLYIESLFDVISKVDGIDLRNEPLIFNDIHIQEDNLLELVQKYKYQSIKKLYGIRYLDTIIPHYQYALMADSEFKCIKPNTLFHNTVQDYFYNSKIKLFYQDFRHGQMNLIKQLVQEIMDFIHVNVHVLPSDTTYMLQDQSWFVQRDIYHGFWNYLEGINQTSILRRIYDNPGNALFGDLAYRYYIYTNDFPGKDRYEFVDVIQQFKTQKGVSPAAYNLILKDQLKNGKYGAFEEISWFPKSLTSHLVDFLNTNKIAFFRNEGNEECFLYKLSKSVETMRYQACSDAYFPISDGYCKALEETELQAERDSLADLHQEEKRLQTAL
ncbi:hypothetical protein BC833DRAFT_584884 [Globomyces pollinis-pini]|nr:hypothetical protein BC833DRAFT_584884 [Globomyces pollinis-pini]